MVIRSIIALCLLSSVGCTEDLRIDLLRFECQHDGQCEGDRVCRATPERGVSVCVEPDVETLCTTDQVRCERPLDEGSGVDPEGAPPPDDEPWEVCALLLSDRKHCGECGRACSATQRCLEGGCRLCPLGQVICGERCVDLNSSAQSCGGCALRCADHEVCLDGECARDCPDTLCETGDCVDLSSSPGHCGACGVSCDLGQACCEGRCLSVEWSVTRCGACDVQCARGELCASGECLPRREQQR